MDDFAPFESSQVLLQETEARIANFERNTAAFLEGCGYTIVRRVDNKAAQQVFSYNFSRRIPPTLRAVASGIVADIKHALDQATCDAILLTRGIDVKSVHFPIGKTRPDFENETKRRLAKAHHELFEFVMALQVHDANDPAFYQFLRLAGGAKHTRLLRVGLSAEGNILHVTPDKALYIPGPATFGSLAWNEARNELDFLRINVREHYEADFSPVLHLQLDKGEPPLDGPAVAIFREMASKAQRIIMALEAEARRIAATL
jgi:hypothetical protein